MRDPRLAEIDFLMDIERQESLEVRIQFESRDARYGLDPGRFSDMVIDLLLSGHVSGSMLRHTGGSLNGPQLLAEQNALLGNLGSGNTIEVFITHAGRLRLWNLRDALLRDADVEPLGLLSKAAWERDVFLRTRFVTAGEPLSVAFLDLDDFGRVNKELGHGIGDDVLRATFSLIKNLVGGRGQVYRFGGEEVGILLPGVTHETACTIAEELRAVIEREVIKKVEMLRRSQTASLGVGTVVEPVNARALLDHVDDLVREAKRAGKNRVVARQLRRQESRGSLLGSSED